jgi:hypothetical protein
MKHCMYGESGCRMLTSIYNLCCVAFMKFLYDFFICRMFNLWWDTPGRERERAVVTRKAKGNLCGQQLLNQRCEPWRHFASSINSPQGTWLCLPFWLHPRAQPKYRLLIYALSLLISVRCCKRVKFRTVEELKYGIKVISCGSIKGPSKMHRWRF